MNKSIKNEKLKVDIESSFENLEARIALETLAYIEANEKPDATEIKKIITKIVEELDNEIN